MADTNQDHILLEGARDTLTSHATHPDAAVAQSQLNQHEEITQRITLIQSQIDAIKLGEAVEAPTALTLPSSDTLLTEYGVTPNHPMRQLVSKLHFASNIVSANRLRAQTDAQLEAVYEQKPENEEAIAGAIQDRYVRSEGLQGRLNEIKRLREQNDQVAGVLGGFAEAIQPLCAVTPDQVRTKADAITYQINAKARIKEEIDTAIVDELKKALNAIGVGTPALEPVMSRASELIKTISDKIGTNTSEALHAASDLNDLFIRIGTTAENTTQIAGEVNLRLAGFFHIDDSGTWQERFASARAKADIPSLVSKIRMLEALQGEQEKVDAAVYLVFGLDAGQKYLLQKALTCVGIEDIKLEKIIEQLGSETLTRREEGYQQLAKLVEYIRSYAASGLTLPGYISRYTDAREVVYQELDRAYRAEGGAVQTFIHTQARRALYLARLKERQGLQDQLHLVIAERDLIIERLRPILARMNADEM